MRIITGKWRGSKLFSLPGENTRPTSDRVKESIFNIIQFDIEGRHVLDCFAGNGQLGLEALSRGAESCVFVDNSKAAVDIINQNVDKLKAREQVRVLNKDGVAYLQSVALSDNILDSTSSARQFGLIFLDPPYQSTYLRKALAAIAEGNLLLPGGLIVCEAARDDHWVAPSCWTANEYIYGRTKVVVYANT